MTETASTYFPDVLGETPLVSGSPGRIHSTDIEASWSGREVRRGHFSQGGYRTFTGQTIPLGRTDSEILSNFLKARRGRLEAFYFYPPQKSVLTLADTGIVGDGIVFAFTLPYKNGTFTQFYEALIPDFSDATPIFVTSQTVDSSAGDSDRIQFTAPVQDGAFLLVDGTARERWTVRSDLDVYDSPLMATTDFHTVWPVKVKEVR